MTRLFQGYRASLLVVAFVLIAFLMSTIARTARPDSLSLTTDAIHPAKRVEASPAKNRLVAVNPPPLLWPVISGRDVRYEVRLSQDARFSGETTINADDLRWAMFNAHQKLADGTWYWQVGTTRRPGADVEWSPVHPFEVDGSARTFVTPSAREMIASVPQKHPRILVSPEDLLSLREKLQGTDTLKSYVRSAERPVGRTLRGVEAAVAQPRGDRCLGGRGADAGEAVRVMAGAASASATCT